MQWMKKYAKLILSIGLLFLPLLIFAQHPEAGGASESHHKEGHFVTIAFEWIEYIADIVGITILVIGFVKGTYMFIRLEFDRILGRKDHEEIFSLRNILGSYIIISLDFLIVSDIIHSILSPNLNDLLNLGIIVVLRTAIGYFLGKELQELRHELKMEDEEAAAKKQDGH
jgi:uncharacterized membrane protein